MSRGLAPLAVLLAALFWVCSGITVATDWPQHAFDAAHSAATPEALPKQLHVRWVLDLPRPRPAWPDQDRLNHDEGYRPIVARGRVIVASPIDDSIAAYDLASGELCWRYFTGGPVRLPPASDGERIFAGSDDGWLYALDIEHGKEQWKFKGAPQSRLVLGNGRLIDTWCVRGGPVVAEGRVYFAAGIWPFMGIFLHCLDAPTGKVIWSNSSEGAVYTVQPHGAGSFGGIAPQGTLAVSGPYLLVPGGRSLPACYDRATGKRKHFLLNTKTGNDAVAADDRHYYCAETSYDLATGKAAGATLAQPVLDSGRLYGFVGDGIGMLPPAPRVETLSKALLSHVVRPAPLARFPRGNALIKAGGRLYAGGKDTVAAFDLPLTAGKPAWQIPVEGTVAALAAAYDHLLVSTKEGRIYCLGAKRGAVAAEPTPQGPPPEEAVLRRAENLLKDAGIDAGHAVVLGAESGELARALALRGNLHVLVLEPDAAKAQTLRAALSEADAYGDRVAVWVGDLASTPLPPYFASLMVAENADSLRADDAWCASLFRMLHPYHGKAYLKLDDPRREALARFAAGDTPGKATLDEAQGLVRLGRSDGLPGAGSWTHEHADAANTRMSADTLVKAPLGLLWFGGPSHDGILPRHGHGPQPQVLDGRLVIERVDGLRSVDIYTGRLLWETDVPGLGSYYNNTAHQCGANATGTNYISTREAIYARYRDECLRFDPATGKPLASFRLPDSLLGAAERKERIWGYLNVASDYLIGGVATPDVQPASRPWMTIGKVLPKAVLNEVPQAVESRALFVMDRHTGKLLWSAAANQQFRHNGVCVGGGKLYAIDRPALVTPVNDKVKPAVTRARLVAFNLATGQVEWTSQREVFGTWLGYSTKHDVLIEAGLCSRDTLPDEARGMRGYRGLDGRELWHDRKAAGPPLIHHDWVGQGQGALGLLDGKPLKVKDPVTGEPRTWAWTRQYGCNSPACSEHLLTFRSGAAGFYDLARFGGTGNWGGFRSSCTNNLIVAGGILTAADYTRTCTCSYQNQTSLALCSDPDAETWTYQEAGLPKPKPVQRLGINFGAPGGRMDDRGTLWMEYPKTADAPTAAAPVRVKAAAGLQSFNQHASAVTGPLPWVCASGILGDSTLRVALGGASAAARRFTVRLYFAEPEALRAGERRFSVSLQGKQVLSDFDVTSEAGNNRQGIVREFSGIEAASELVIALVSQGDRPALLCGLEIVAEEEQSGAIAAPEHGQDSRVRAAQ